MLARILLILVPFALFSNEMQSELKKINIPANPWLVPSADPAVLDVAIIGGGMSGAAAAFALTAEGITNIKMFDENPRGLEGPWLRYARMPTLRSIKTYMGPAYGIPKLTFQSWFEEQYGEEEWKGLGRISTEQWSEYLLWYSTVLNLPCVNGYKLCTIYRSNGLFTLIFETADSYETVSARKIILATGRDGSGGYVLPNYAAQIPKNMFTHTNETIPKEAVQGKFITIIGCGASAFDAAAFALESGAKQVEMLVRRSAVPQVNKFALFYHPGIIHGFYQLSDELRCEFFGEALEWGIPPPKTALERLEGYRNFHIHYCTVVEDITASDRLYIQTNRGTLKSDFLIFATGFDVDLSKREELTQIYPHIALWEDHVPSEVLQRLPKLARFPYLGDHFQFLQNNPLAASWVSDIYCFNYGASLSLGMLAADIPAISVGARRLATGIAADFFLANQEQYLKAFQSYDQNLFECDDFDILNEDSSCPLCE